MEKIDETATSQQNYSGRTTTAVAKDEGQSVLTKSAQDKTSQPTVMLGAVTQAPGVGLPQKHPKSMSVIANSCVPETMFRRVVKLRAKSKVFQNRTGQPQLNVRNQSMCVAPIHNSLELPRPSEIIFNKVRSQPERHKPNFNTTQISNDIPMVPLQKLNQHDIEAGLDNSIPLFKNMNNSIGGSIGIRNLEIQCKVPAFIHSVTDMSEKSSCEQSSATGAETPMSKIENRFKEKIDNMTFKMELLNNKSPLRK